MSLVSSCDPVIKTLPPPRLSNLLAAFFKSLVSASIFASILFGVIIVVNGNSKVKILSYVFLGERFLPVPESIIGSKMIGILISDSPLCIILTRSTLPIMPILHAEILKSLNISLICSSKKIGSWQEIFVTSLVFCAVNDVITVTA